MRIAIMAAGGVGGYFGARLADNGEDVSFIARGEHLKAINSGGLRIESALGDLHLENVNATDNIAEVGPVDVVIFAVKLWDTESAAEACKPLLKEDTLVISGQNGIESLDVLSKVLGPQHAVGGAAYIASVIGAPGTIRHTGNVAKLVMGRPDNSRPAQLEAFLNACNASGFEATIADDIRKVLWEKFVFMAPVSAATTATQMPLGFIFGDSDMRPVIEQAMLETVAVGRAKGVSLTDDAVGRQMAFGDALPDQARSSMMQDREKGRRLETPWLSGTLVRLGKELGIETPINTTLYATVKPYINGAP